MSIYREIIGGNVVELLDKGQLKITRKNGAGIYPWPCDQVTKQTWIPPRSEFIELVCNGLDAGEYPEKNDEQTNHCLGHDD